MSEIVISVFREIIVSDNGGATAYNRNPLAYFCGFSLLLLLLYLPNFSKYSYHEKVSYQLSAQHKVGLMSIFWEHVVSAYGAPTTYNR